MQRAAKFISKKSLVLRHNLRVRGLNIEARDVKAIRNFLLACVIAIFVIIAIYFALSKSTASYLRHGNGVNEEVAWYFINDNFINSEKSADDDYYLFFQDYIQEVVNKIPAQSLPKGYKIQVIVINDNSINAFAAPGGRIILTRGLLDRIKSENGLMFVVGHEIGHLHKKDHIKEFARSFGATIISTMFFSGNIEIVDLLLMLENASTRKAEFEADQWGLNILLSLYGHAGGATEFFNILAENNIGIYNQENSFASHPSTKVRHDQINNKIQKERYPIHHLVSFE